MRRKIFLVVFVSTLFTLLLPVLPAIAGFPLPPIPPLPPLIIPKPPEVVVVPNTYVYFPPAVDVDIFFFQGYWYRPHEGRWYRTTNYKGSWSYIENHRVPASVLNLPPRFRDVPPGHERIPYGQMKKNWKTWEREKHWDKHKKHEAKERHKSEHKEFKEQKNKGKGKGH